MKNLFLAKYTRIIAACAFLVALVDVQACCPFYNYQPKMPKELQKLKKHDQE